MTHYRLFLLSHDGHITQGLTCECESDTDAFFRAIGMTDPCAAVEVWDGDRMVGRVPKPGTRTADAKRRAQPVISGDQFG